MGSTNLHSYATRLATIARTLFLPQSLPLRAIHFSEAFVVVVVTKSLNLFTTAAAFRTTLLTVRYLHGSRNSIVSTVPILRAVGSAVRIPATKSIFLFSETSTPTLVSNQPPTQSVPGIRSPERDGEHAYKPELRNE